MTGWTDFIKKYAQENKISYGCALSMPDCSQKYYEQKNKQKLIRMKRDEDYKKNKNRFIKRIRDVELANMGSEDVNQSGYINEINKLLDVLPKLKKDWISKNFYISSNGNPMINTDNIRHITEEIMDIQREIVKIAREHNEIPKKYLRHYPSASYKGDYFYGFNSFSRLSSYFDSNMRVSNIIRDIIYSTDFYNEQVSKYLSKYKKLDKRQIGMLDKLKSKIDNAQNKYDDYIELILMYMQSIIDSPAFGIERNQKFRGMTINE
jgi:hypothetical protein